MTQTELSVTCSLSSVAVLVQHMFTYAIYYFHHLSSVTPSQKRHSSKFTCIVHASKATFFILASYCVRNTEFWSMGSRKSMLLSQNRIVRLCTLLKVSTTADMSLVFRSSAVSCCLHLPVQCPCVTLF